MRSVARETLLTCVYRLPQAVAARLGLELCFVNFPGHVLLRVAPQQGDSGTGWYLDPAANGRRLSSAAARP